MSLILYVGFALLGLTACAIFGAAASAVQEGVAAILLLAAITCLIGGGICTRLDSIRKVIERSDTASK